MNSSNFNKNQQGDPVGKAAQKAGIDPQELKKAAHSGRLESYLEKSLSPELSKKLKSVLSDKKALQSLLDSPESKELLRRFGKD